MLESLPKIPRGREKLSRVIQYAGDIVRIEDAEKALGLDRLEASKLLSRWTGQGWLRRVGAGAYAPVPIDSLQSKQVLGDPWVLVPVLFAPAYIGGRTAAEHWDLTEQIFRDIVVFTARNVRSKNQERHGAVFTLKHCAEEKQFGTRTIWREKTRVNLSDIHRTVIDMLAEPSIGGGIQHVDDCFAQYLNRPDADYKQLLSYAARLNNGAVFKRLGFLAERKNAPAAIISECQAALTKGNVKLDPSMKCPRLITRWRLFVPETWAGARND